MAAWLSSELARRAARRIAGELRRRGPGPWFPSSSTVPVLGPTAGYHRGFCSVRRFAGDTAAAAATAEDSDNEFAAGDLQQVPVLCTLRDTAGVLYTHSSVGRLLIDICVL
jgi:2-oxoisovalerate dehydrogenase E1 component alpha subunit